MKNESTKPIELLACKITVIFKQGFTRSFRIALENLNTRYVYYTIDDIARNIPNAFCEYNDGATFVRFTAKENALVDESVIIINRNDVSAIVVGDPEKILYYGTNFN